MGFKLKRKEVEQYEIDMTPMIDMTFQLIAFFMILINFEAAEQDSRVVLPSSQLAKPPEAPFETPITIQMTKDGNPLLAAEVYADRKALIPKLKNEVYVLQTQNSSAANATIIIRAHKDCKTGDVQDLIKVCQEVGFEKFTLRANEEIGY
ncbi:biopolymer transport protein ExbD [Anatilimnocola aggregata]|uniref:Biopolymer transport protein ExbD n=1 Tax=Anatilimnocola aggregata TaxID=2528021 RepID=A0A517Y4Z8_9BACT|nr:biopolymer transporter ExbD [Anatilimnocola aggregata]QDU25321.1 biopolymer transport protein ExbD [Anatilimnocola aggregata]